MMRRRNPAWNPLDDVLDDGSPVEQQGRKPAQPMTERFSFFATVVLFVTVAISFGKWTVTTVLTTSPSTFSFLQADKLMLVKYNISEMCENITASLVQEQSTKYFECGRRRLLQEYGASISLDRIELDPNNGTGIISATLCNSQQSGGEDCSIGNNKLNASDLLLWVRFRSPEIVFAVDAQAAGDDCRSWHAKFQLPALAESTTYQIDIMTLWLYGHPIKARWISDSDRKIKRNMVWTGTPYSVPKGPILYGEYMRDGRWMVSI